MNDKQEPEENPIIRFRDKEERVYRGKGNWDVYVDGKYVRTDWCS